MKHCILILFVLTLFTSLLADSAVELWTFSHDDIWGSDMVALPCGDIFMIGGNTFYNGEDFITSCYVTRFDTQGDTLFGVDIFPFNKERVHINRLLDSGDGNLIAVGGAADVTSANVIGIVLKLDYDGELIWQQSFTGNSVWALCDAAVDTNNNIYIASANEDRTEFLLTALSSGGVEQWRQQWTMDNAERAELCDVLVTSAGDIVTAGYCRFEDDSRLYIDKFSAVGSHLWSNEIETNDEYHLTIPEIALGDADKVALLGTESVGEWMYAHRIWTYDSFGQLDWTWSPYDDGIWLNSQATMTSRDGKFYVSSALSLNGEDDHSYVACIDSEGGQVWKTVREDAPREFPDKIYVHHDNDTYINGFYNNGVMNMKFNHEGVFQWWFYKSVNEWRDETFCYKILAVDDPDDPETRYVYALDINTAGGMILFCYEEEVELAVEDDIPQPDTRLVCSPNPFNPETTVRFSLPQSGETTIELYDIRGRKAATLLHSHLEAGDHSCVWKADNLPSGVYLLRLTAPGLSVSQKALLLK